MQSPGVWISLYWRAEVNGVEAQPWTNLSLNGARNATIVKNTDGFTVYAVASTFSPRLYKRTYTASTNTWNFWSYISAAQCTGSGSASAARVTSSSAEVFCSTSSGEVGYYHDDALFPTWTTLPGVSSDTDPLALATGQDFAVFASKVAGTRTLNRKTHNSQIGWLRGWNEISPPAPFTSIGGASYHSTRMDLFGQVNWAPDGGYQLSHLSYEGGWMTAGVNRSWDDFVWDYGPLFASYIYKPAAVSTGTGKLDVFYVDYYTRTMKRMFYPFATCGGLSASTQYMNRRPPPIRASVKTNAGSDGSGTGRPDPIRAPGE